MTTREELEQKSARAKSAGFNLRIIKGAEAVARIRKEDLASLTAPSLEQGGETPPPPAAPLATAAQAKPRGLTEKTIDFHGLPVSIDRPVGHVQNGIDARGKAWKRIYHVDYGYVPSTQGGDGEGIDVYTGLDKDVKSAHWILQKKLDGSFDEYKVMLGFEDPDMAKGMYLAHTPKKYFGGVASTSIQMMKALLGLHPQETLKALVSFVVDGEPVDLEPEPETVTRKVKLAKGALDADQRFVLGVVLEPNTVDAQEDEYNADEVRKAAWGYMVSFRNVGLMHKGLVNQKVELVESYIAPTDFTVGGSTIKAGTWLMGLHVNDDAIWEDVKKGALTGLSIGGFATKNPL